MHLSPIENLHQDPWFVWYSSGKLAHPQSVINSKGQRNVRYNGRMPKMTQQYLENSRIAVHPHANEFCLRGDRVESMFFVASRELILAKSSFIRIASILGVAARLRKKAKGCIKKVGSAFWKFRVGGVVVFCVNGAFSDELNEHLSLCSALLKLMFRFVLHQSVCFLENVMMHCIFHRQYTKCIWFWIVTVRLDLNYLGVCHIINNQYYFSLTTCLKINILQLYMKKILTQDAKKCLGVGLLYYFGWTVYWGF